MKVAMANYFHPFSGIGKYPFNLFKTFRKQRKQVDMIYLENRHNKIKSQPGIKKVRLDTPYIELNKTILPYFYFPTKMPDGYDVYHAANQFLSRIAIYKKPCVITHHDIRPIVLPHDFKMRAIGFTLKYLLKFYKKASHIISISNEAKQSLLDLRIVPEEKITVIYHGYDADIYKPIKKSVARKKLGLPQDAKIVLNVGTEDKMRRLTLLFKSMIEIQKTEPEVLLVRVGGSAASGGYWKTSEDLKEQVKMRQFKNVLEEDMPLIYSAADVLVSPQAYSEGFTYPPLEGMACGLPIMTSNMRVFEKWGPMIPNNHKELSEMVLRILNNKSVHSKMSKKSLEGAKEFSLAKEAKATYEVYEEASRK
jgi:glycosyltransferase involved in cell wall biosynthesis